jgi:hypothetical protein
MVFRIEIRLDLLLLGSDPGSRSFNTVPLYQTVMKSLIFSCQAEEYNSDVLLPVTTNTYFLPSVTSKFAWTK